MAGPKEEGAAAAAATARRGRLPLSLTQAYGARMHTMCVEMPTEV